MGRDKAARIIGSFAKDGVDIWMRLSEQKRVFLGEGWLGLLVEDRGRSIDREESFHLAANHCLDYWFEGVAGRL